LVVPFGIGSKARYISGGARRLAMLRSTALTLRSFRGHRFGDHLNALALLPATLRCRRCFPYLVEDAVAFALLRRLHCSQPPRPLYLGQQHEPAE
jgi:hypothetical protein